MATKKDNRIRSATFFVTMMDFSEAGELGVFIDEEQLQRARGEDEQARLSRRLRDGDHVQHAAGQRPDLVVRGEQLPAGQRSVPVRPAVLECGFDAHAGADAQLLSAQDVPAEPAGGAGRDQPGGRADRSAQDQDAGVFPVHARGSHRAVEVDLSRHPVAERAEAVRAGGVGAYRRRGQSAGRREIQPLDQHRSAGRSGRVVQGRHRDRRFMVARLAPLGDRAGEGAGSRRGCLARAS